MHSTRIRLATLGLLLTATASAARAQDQAPPPPPPPPMMLPPGGMGGPGGPSLLMFSQVQEDLGLTDKQKAQLKRLEQTMMQKRREAMPAPGDGPPDPQAMISAMNELRREHDAAVAKILDKHQKARLAQLEIQREGLLAVARQDVSSKLKLTGTQARKIKAILDEMRQGQARALPLPPGGPGGSPPRDIAFPVAPPGATAPASPPNFDSEEMRAQFTRMREAQEKARARATEQIEGVLTKEQKAAFEKLVGKPFDFSTMRLDTPPSPSETPRGNAKGKSRKSAGR